MNTTLTVRVQLRQSSWLLESHPQYYSQSILSPAIEPTQTETAHFGLRPVRLQHMDCSVLNHKHYATGRFATSGVFSRGTATNKMTLPPPASIRECHDCVF